MHGVALIELRECRLALIEYSEDLLVARISAPKFWEMAGTYECYFIIL